jgi:hypothetical protein
MCQTLEEHRGAANYDKNGKKHPIKMPKMKKPGFAGLFQISRKESKTTAFSYHPKAVSEA